MSREGKEDTVEELSVSGALPKAAFELYRGTAYYKNARNRARHEKYVDGALWAAFVAGYETASDSFSRVMATRDD